MAHMEPEHSNHSHRLTMIASTCTCELKLTHTMIKLEIFAVGVLPRKFNLRIILVVHRSHNREHFQSYGMTWSDSDYYMVSVVIGNSCQSSVESPMPIPVYVSTQSSFVGQRLETLKFSIRSCPRVGPMVEVTESRLSTAPQPDLCDIRLLDGGPDTSGSNVYSGIV